MPVHPRLTTTTTTTATTHTNYHNRCTSGHMRARSGNRPNPPRSLQPGARPHGEPHAKTAWSASPPHNQQGRDPPTTSRHSEAGAPRLVAVVAGEGGGLRGQRRGGPVSRATLGLARRISQPSEAGLAGEGEGEEGRASGLRWRRTPPGRRKSPCRAQGMEVGASTTRCLPRNRRRREGEGGGGGGGELPGSGT